MKEKLIHILPIGDIKKEVLKKISVKLTDVFGFKCEVCQNLDNPSYAYNPTRRQHHSTLILKKMNDIIPQDSFKVLGVTDVDLSTPILTFVFGEAQLGKRCAIISLYRLRPEFYGHPRLGGKILSTLFFSRIEKEAIHEIGHTFGLTHCSDANCVMHSSNTIYDTDVKADSLCPSCNKLLSQKIVEDTNKGR